MGMQRVVARAKGSTVWGAALGLFLAAGPTAGAGELGKLTLQDKPLALLGGRVLVRMPEGAKVEPRKAASLMGLDPSADEEGRIVLDAGNERFVLMARETFQWADKNVKEVLQKQYADCAIAPLREGKEGPTSYLLVPKAVTVHGTATGVAFACLVLPDKTVVRLGAYVNPEACDDLPGCAALAKEVLSHAAGGNVPLQCEAGTKRLRAGVQGKDVQVDLPRDYILTFQRGPDFWLYYARPLSPFGAVPPTVLLYQGGHPSAFHTKGEGDSAEPPEVTSTDGTFLGQKASWAKWTSGAGDKARTCAEAIVSSGDLWKFHVYFSGRSADEMGACEKIAQSMALVDKEPDAAAKPAPDTEGAAPGK